MLTSGTLSFQAGTIPALLHQRARDFPQQPCYVFPDSGHTCTWQWLWQQVQAVAAGLRRLGLRRHERVAILLEGRAEQLVCLYAAIAAGGVAVPLSTYLTVDELKGCLLEAQPAVFIMGSAGHHLAYGQLQEAVAAQPGPAALSATRWVPHHAFVQGAPPVPPGSAFRSYEELAAPAALLPAALPPAGALPLTVHDPALLLFSSGTTGRPKAIVRSTASLLARPSAAGGSRAGVWQAFVARRGNAFVNRFGVLSLLPVYHLAGLGVALTPLLVCNVPVALLSRFNPARAVAAVASTKARFLATTPHMLQVMLASEQAATARLDSVLGIIFASAALRPQVVRQMLEGFRNLYFFTVSYGSTETNAIASGVCYPHHRQRPVVALLLHVVRRLRYLEGEIPLAAFTSTTASIGGRVARHVHVGIRSPHTGEWLPAGQEGEILVRSHQLMPYQDEALNHERVVEGNWFRTGDLGYVDARGCLLITDRLKRMISRGGEKIGPAEVEDVLRQQPGIEEALVLSLPDAVYGEAVGAAYTEQRGASVSVAALQTALGTTLSSFKVPQHFLRLAAFPLSATGKIDVAAVRNELMQQIGRHDA